MRELSVETTTHGRVLIEEPAGADPIGLLVVFHGYGQRAEDALDQIRRIPGAPRWRIASVQALHLFYTRDSRAVVASWMTRERRDVAIADNVAYVDRAIEAALYLPALHASTPSGPHALVFVGFSQGASMAYRAALLGRHRPHGVVALAGDIPPELAPIEPARWPPVLIGAGETDTWFTGTKLDGDLSFLSARGVTHEVIRFKGGHEWTPEFREAVGAWLSRIART